MEAVIQISEVNSKDVNTSRGASTVYSIKSVDGKEFSTFKKDLGQEAGRLRGQVAVVEYQEVVKGKYTNYYLDGIKPAEGLTEAPGATSVVTGEAVKLSAPAVSHNITYKDEKSAQINRSVAFKAAVELVTSGYLDYPGVDGIDRLTSELIPVVEGSFTKGEAAPLDGNQSSGEAGDIVAEDGSLVKF